MNNKVILEVKDLKKSYHEGKITTEVLKGINLQIFEGEMVAIVGSSGSGKSTLLHMLGTLDRPSSGQILFKDEEISQWSSNRQADFRNHSLGFIYQFHHLLNEFTAVENVHSDELLLNSFTAVVDAGKCKMYVKNFGEFFINQIEHANAVVLSHTRGLSDTKLDICVKLIREHNPTAQLVTTDWDNELVYLYLYSNNNRIIAIEMKTDHKTDSLVSIYSNKYGEAEHISDLDYSKYKYIKRHANENDLDSLFGESVVYTWTFKNAIVQISGHRKTESLGIYDEGYKSVLYFDNECNALLDKYRARVRALRQEQEKKENAEAQRIKDSVWQAVQKERLEKKQNHEKSIKQI